MSVVTLSLSRHPVAREITRDDVLRKYPRLISHMICESLGYFSPLCAANALAHHISGQPFSCEWYSHICSCRGKGYFDEAELLKIGGDVVSAAFKQRSHHKGFMAEYRHALTLVMAERQKRGCTDGMLASWF
jgi:hypothetical protein